jgi:hypothetical protein
MKRLLLALAMGVVLLLLAGVATATAGELPGQNAAQSSGQAAGSQQGAGSAAGTAQQGPSNSNSPVRVLSPSEAKEAGSVTQTNQATSNATAGNSNGTAQSAGQTQGGGSGVQAIGQSATNAQDALALALTLQKGASNENTPVRVGSEGDDGSVSQSNAASSDATAGNANATQQGAGQTQAGGCCDGAGTQAIGQSAGNEQDAAALSATVQEKPSNTNLPVRVGSAGSDGSVSQTNEASSNATAGNLNGTTQSAEQDQAHGSSPCGCGYPSTIPSVCGCSTGSGTGTQTIGQEADNSQKAFAASETVQTGASNENISVRVLSPGNNGSVSQSNVATSNAAAGNANKTEQSADQSQAGSGGSQSVGQSASNDQGAAALSGTVQEHPSNKNISVRVLSEGDDGDVTQSNIASSNATAANVNGTKQTADQTAGSDSCKCGSGGTQAIGQSADSKQGALAGSITKQSGASNENISVRVLSPGSNGSVNQSNVATSNAAAGNANWTGQTASQTQSGDSCKCGGGGTQAIGQSASNHQGAAALSATIQEKPSNSNTPVRVLSEGDDGDVTQSNVATSNAHAGNLNGTGQSATQSQGGGSGIQVIGQEAKNGQLALSGALTAQIGASNTNAPVRVESPGNGGSVSQTNAASSNATAGNANWTGQNAAQQQGGRQDSCCGGTGIQAIGQSASNHQAAGAFAVTLQLGLTPPCKCHPDSQLGNSNAPTRVLSPGDDGAVRQSNVAASEAKAANLNATKQDAEQLQPTRCRCKADTPIQAIGQLADNAQLGASFAATLQLGGKNAWSPDRKSSPGNFAGLDQMGTSAAHDAYGGRNSTDQSRSQAGNQLGSQPRRW